MSVVPDIPPQPLYAAVNNDGNTVIVDTRSISAPDETAVIMPDKTLVLITTKSGGAIFIKRPNGAVTSLDLDLDNKTPITHWRER